MINDAKINVKRHMDATKSLIIRCWLCKTVYTKEIKLEGTKDEKRQAYSVSIQEFKIP